MSSGQSGGDSAQGAGLSRLTENEQKLVAKLLSDPTYFPIEFRTWLKQFIEGSGIIITASQIQGGQGTNVATGLPAGAILPVAAGGAIPADCLICDGTVKVRADYPLLFSRIGVAWGAGDGSTTFNVPDLRDRTLYGAGGQVGVGQTDGVAFGSRGGPIHHHFFQDTKSLSINSVGDHTHPITVVQASASNILEGQQANRSMAVTLVSGLTTGGGGGHGHSGSVQVSGDTSGGYLQDKGSFAGVIYVITIGTAA